jgi:hypothetical protein
MKSLLRQAWAADCPVYFEEDVAYRPVELSRILPPPAPAAAMNTEPATSGPDLSAGGEEEGGDE